MLKVTSDENAGKSTDSPAADLERVAASLQVIVRSFNQARSHEQLLREAGVRLDRAGAALLYKLHAHGDTSFRVSELAERLGIDAPSVTRKVQQLERLGYVSRDADPEDKRATRIQLTREGEVTLDQIIKARKKRLVRLFEGWTQEEIRDLSLSLGRFAESLTKEMELYRD